MKAIALLFALLTMGVASAEAKVPCKLPLYIQAEQGPAVGMTDSTVSLFLYSLKSAVTLHDGCIVDKMADAHLDLYFTTIKLLDAAGRSDSSIIAVALAVPLNGIPVYMDHYVLIVRQTDSIDGQVNALLQSIGETLDRHTSPGQ
ncbi:MAG TPA: hypothetical protein VGM27_19080 [Acidobacteriaceae bacterium]